MNMRLLLFPLFLLLLAIPAAAQSAGTITGTVVDADGAPVAGAAVEVLGSAPKLGSYARRDGTYRIRAIRPGEYRLRITAPGHASDTVTVTVTDGRETSLGLTLAAIPVGDAFEGYELLGSETKSDGALDGGGRLMMSRPATIGRTSIARRGGGAAAAESATASSADFGGDGSAGAPPPPPSMTPAPMLAMSDGAGSHAKAARAEGMPRPAEGTTVTEEREEPKQPERPGQLTAGEWCDLVNWTYWLEVVGTEEWGSMPAHWGFDPSSRISVIATDGERLIADAEVTLTDGQTGTLWKARTDNRGRAELFVGVAGRPAGTYRIEVRAGEAQAIINNVAAPSSGPVIAKLRNAPATPAVLDLMFVIDCTGSMGDELAYVKSELESVIDRVRDNHSDRIAIRMSTNFYRDRGDEYVVRSFPFTESSFEAIGWIRDQEANNGGDFPEAVEEALEDGIEKHDWSPSAKARLMFLVLDAPPHYDEARLKSLQAMSKRAAEKGIRIIPVASSGIDKETEFLLRLLGIYSGGTYTFLTDDSGIGSSHLKPTVGRYDVEYLDNLMVRLIGRWLEDVAIDDALRASLR